MHRTLLDCCVQNVEQNDFEKMYRGKQSAKQIPNPNIEIRNKLESKQISNRESSKRRMEMMPVWNFLYFGHLQLFRISSFVLRIWSSWALARDIITG